MGKNIEYIDLEFVEYLASWNLQEKKLKDVLRNRNNSFPKEYLLLCEHPHVYTLGKSGEKSNLLVNDKFLNKNKMQFVKTNRGGDITYHGPGQLVGYPIIDLYLRKMTIKKYIEKLEESVILFLQKYNIYAKKKEKIIGLWVEKEKHLDKKICSIGVRVSRGITMHGFALNINTDINYFSFINPCGFENESITSMELELGSKVNMDDAKTDFKEIFFKLFS